MGDPILSTEISNDLIHRFGHYVQAINFPTVPKGEEKLRIAPTPHHTKEMMDKFVEDLTVAWKDAGMELNPVGNSESECPIGQSEGTCDFCKEPGLFSNLEARVRGQGCQMANCPQVVPAA